MFRFEFTFLFLSRNMMDSYNKSNKLFCLFVLFTIMFVVLFSETEATYRKPPFNGSIFGKRGSTAGNLEKKLFVVLLYNTKY